MSDRIEMIKSMLATSPENVFLHYSLGMEYLSAGRADDAVAEFRACIARDASYLPAYVEAGKALRQAGRLDEAREIFATGRQLAEAAGDTHMSDHIRQQLESL